MPSEPTPPAAAADPWPREVLPIPDPPYAGTVVYDARSPEAKFPPIRPLRPPAGAPNVLVVLLDDVGFGASSAFGGPVHTPTAERLAAGGLKYTRFHTTAICSPTRAALVTGRNHHSVGMGGITEMATAAPGYTSVHPNTCATVAEVLKLNGYGTAHIGKCHEVPAWETSPAGPFDRWPSPGNGFEYFYGFFGGETDQYYPTLREGLTRVEPWGTPEEGYHPTEDLTDKAIACSCSRTSASSASRSPTRTTPWAGRTPCAPPTSGRSRWPPTGAAPATAPSCTGPTASPPGARCATSSPT